MVPVIRRALILGASGQLGVELQRTVPAGVAIVALDIGDVDIRDGDAVTRAITSARPEAVFNCAAFTNVDGAESARDEAMAANGVAPGIIAAACVDAGARLLHVSTDYVFDGNASTPYPPSAPTSPLNVYGASKLEGERRVHAAAGGAAVVRTAWLHSGGGVNFVKTAVRVLGSGSPMRVVDDQIGTPTRARHLAQALWSLSARPDITGTLHFTDAGVASWYDVAVAVDGCASRRRPPNSWGVRGADLQRRAAGHRASARVFRARQTRVVARHRLRSAALARGHRRVAPTSF